MRKQSPAIGAYTAGAHAGHPYARGARLRIAPDLSNKNPAWVPTRARIVSFNFLNRPKGALRQALVVPLKLGDRKSVVRSSNLPRRATSEYAIGANRRRSCAWAWRRLA